MWANIGFTNPSNSTLFWRKQVCDKNQSPLCEDYLIFMETLLIIALSKWKSKSSLSFLSTCKPTIEHDVSFFMLESWPITCFFVFLGPSSRTMYSHLLWKQPCTAQYFPSESFHSMQSKILRLTKTPLIAPLQFKASFFFSSSDTTGTMWHWAHFKNPSSRNTGMMCVPESIHQTSRKSRLSTGRCLVIHNYSIKETLLTIITSVE